MTYDSGGHLTGQEIRLLEIIPSKSVSDLLQCRLIRIRLDETDQYPYEALSYVWGNVANIAEIYCNEELISVTLNLADALNKLRLPQKSRFIWADALCIDQNSISEKNCQIPLMGKIYSRARRVVVWLGAFESDGPESIQEIVKT
ncbi:heterokaryon incompatibility protein-domain-containing protein, partial [Paraphoma chrysanthemicola]